MRTSVASLRTGRRATRRMQGPTAKSTLAWVAILGFGGITLVGVMRRGDLLGFLYPASALATAAILYAWRPALYAGFVCVLWFMTPLVRRLVDYQIGYDPLNPVLVAPALATSLCVWSLLRHFPKLQRTSLVALLPLLTVLVYAYLVGISRNGWDAATYALLLWLGPLAFGFHIAIGHQRYQSYRAVLRGVLVVAALVLGLYGVWQFINPPPWDRYWMLNSGMLSVGRPFPYQVRVFSTLNSPAPFALVMLAGLLMLLDTRAVVHWTVGIPAYLAFLLSLVRTAWAGWIVGLAVYAFYLPNRTRLRIFASLLVAALLIELVASSPIQRVIGDRVLSLTELSQDKSLSERMAFYETLEPVILGEPLGRGLGATGSGNRLVTGNPNVFDSGLLDLFVSLGWVGGMLYLGGTLVVLLRLRHRFEPRTDAVPRAARALAVATIVTLGSMNSLTAVTGVLFWGLVGLALGGRAWYRTAAPPIPGELGPQHVPPAPASQVA